MELLKIALIYQNCFIIYLIFLFLRNISHCAPCRTQTRLYWFRISGTISIPTGQIIILIQQIARRAGFEPTARFRIQFWRLLSSTTRAPTQIKKLFLVEMLFSSSFKYDLLVYITYDFLALIAWPKR